MNVSGIKAKEIKEQLKVVESNVERYYFDKSIFNIIDELKKDDRKAVIKLGEGLEKKVIKLQQEIDRVKTMYDFDNFYGKNRVIAGVDEVGRGPLAGPIVSAAVVLKRDILDDSQFILGIKDSKKINAIERERLYDVIIDNALDYSINLIDNYEIDSKGIAWCNNEIFKRDVLNLKVNPDYVLCDGYRIRDFHIENEAVIKGDNKSASIACASIIAKVYRDRIMREYHEKYPQYDFINNMGYGTKTHIEALKKYGPCEIHRESFIRNILGPTLD